MLTKRYLPSTKNVPAIFQQIVSGTAPDKFSVEHLRNIGFGSSNDRAIIPLMKDLGFLTADGTPTQRYHNYRNASLSKKVMGEAIKEAYQPVFHVKEKPTKTDKVTIVGLFKSTHNVADRVAECMAATFFSLLDLADLSDGPITTTPTIKKKDEDESDALPSKKKPSEIQSFNTVLGHNFRYNIEIHLPASKDIEVYNAIFKSLKEHLINE